VLELKNLDKMLDLCCWYAKMCSGLSNKKFEKFIVVKKPICKDKLRTSEKLHVF